MVEGGLEDRPQLFKPLCDEFGGQRQQLKDPGSCKEEE